MDLKDSTLGDILSMTNLISINTTNGKAETYDDLTLTQNDSNEDIGQIDFGNINPVSNGCGNFNI